MSYATFTENSNSSRTITMKNLQYTISDTVTSDDNSVFRKGITINIQSWAKRSEVANYLAWSDMGQKNTLKRNRVGTLTFSDFSGGSGGYMTINDVYIVSIEETSETWREWGQVNITFQNDNMITSSSAHTQFVGNGTTVDIYNVRLNISPSTIRKNHNTIPHWNGSFYQETGYEITRVQLSGVIPYDSCDFPEKIISAFECFYVENNCLIPIEGPITTFLPELKFDGTGQLKNNNSNGKDLPGINNVFVERASLNWNIEKKIINVNVSFVGPHQKI